MSANLADRFLPSPFVRGAVHAGRTILLDLSRERYYGLDEVGTRVWALLEEGAQVRAIVACLGEEYDAPRERLEADVADILRYLLGLKVIVPVGRLRPPSSLSSALTLIGATMGLRVLGLRRSLALAQRLGPRPPPGESPTPEFLADVVRKVGTAGTFFPGRALCLEQSVAVYLCLRRAGVPAELRIGVQPLPFAAHAWVEYRGEPVGETHDRVGKFVSFGDLKVP